MEKKAPTKKKIPPDARAVAAIALLLEGVDDDRFEEGFRAIIDSLKARVQEAWAERRLKKVLFDPLMAAIESKNPHTIIEVISHNDTAMSLLNKMHAESK